MPGIGPAALSALSALAGAPEIKSVTISSERGREERRGEERGTKSERGAWMG